MKNTNKVFGFAIIAVIAFSTLAFSGCGGKSLNSDKRNTLYLARQYAKEWGGKIDGYIKVLQTLSNIMNFYENLPAAERRQTYEQTMQAVFEDMPDFVQMFTVWKPNALDGMDARYTGRVGSTATGQFAYALARDTGRIAPTANTVVQETMEWINGPNARQVWISDPSPFKNQGKDTFAVRIAVPIINKRLNEAVGAIGCFLDIAWIQPMLERTIKENEEVTSIAIYTDSGFILASYLPERIGKTLNDTEAQYGDRINDAFDAVKTGKEFSLFGYDPVLQTNMVMVIADIPIGASPTTWSVMISSTEAYLRHQRQSDNKDLNAILRLLALLL